jgi:hypothetical protein
MHPTKARTHFWYLLRLLLGLVLFYFLITPLERSTVLLRAVGVVLLHGIVTFFASALMAPGGHAHRRPLVSLSHGWRRCEFVYERVETIHSPVTP